MLERWAERVWYGRNTLRFVLSPLALVFELLVVLRRAAYSHGLLASERLAVPVVVIGNVTVGGTGKTPLLIRLAAELGARGLRVGIVTRGYGGGSRTWPRRVGPDDDAAEVGDEAVLLARRTQRPVVAGPDRVAAARELVAAADVDVLLSDDGLQHYRLARAFEIAVVDGARGLGNGFLLPAGPLREPAARLRTVDAVVVNGPGFEHPGAYRARMAVTRVYALADGAETTLAAFAGKTVHAVAGVGHPSRFFSMLRAADVVVVEHALPDHGPVEPALRELAGSEHAVLMTEKDAVKCPNPERRDVWCVAADLEVEDGERLVDDVLASIGEVRGSATITG